MTTQRIRTLSPDINILGLHHAAYRCRDAEETRHFYEDILGLPLFHYIEADHVPSTGEYCPYVHIFFQLADGSCIAFFDLDDTSTPAPSPNTPLWVNHIAFAVDSLETLSAIKQTLEQHGIEVIGITDHKIFKSIYFFDPNGIRLELTAQLADTNTMRQHQVSAREKLNAWQLRKRNRIA